MAMPFSHGHFLYVFISQQKLQADEDSTVLNDTAAGITRSFFRLLAAYPRFKFFRPKMQASRFEKFQVLAPVSVQAAATSQYSASASTLPPMSRSLPFAVNMVSGIALFRIYDTSKPEQAGVLDCAKSGVMGGMVHGLIMHPFEVTMMRGLRTWRQLPGALNSCLHPGVMLSSPLTVARDGLGFGLFFGVYEGVRQISGQTSILATAIAGVAGAAAHHVVAYPSHSIRDLLGPHAIHSSPQQIFSVIRKHRKTLFNGFFRSMLRSLPGGALTFVVYETMLSPLETKEALTKVSERFFPR